MDFDSLIELAIQIQQIPAPTFDEAQRADFVRRLFEAESLADVQTDRVGNVYARLEGTSPAARPLVVSAHLDTVFPLETDLQVTRRQDRIIGPGIGDNSLGVAGLFGLLWLLRERDLRLPGDLWLVANVCEEGLGDLRGMRAVVERFGSAVQAYIVLEGMALGYIYHRALSVERYRICAQTAGGHSWKDYGQPSAIHELAALVTRLTSLPLPGSPRTTLNVGKFVGGTSVNVLAAEACLELDLRSESAGTLAEVTAQVKALVKTARRPGVKFSVQPISTRPAGELPASHPLVRLAEESLRLQGIHPNLIIGSTDANLPLSKGYPAVCIGLTTGGSAHTAQEFIHTLPLQAGMEQLLHLVGQIWKMA
ncbi:MAG: M20/M25/M40 family metallo-hydrolase [Candidatus Villigracilaceae bacterium]